METSIIDVLTQKYELKSNAYYTKYPSDPDGTANQYHHDNHYRPFYDKWIKYTEEGWYGPAGLGYPMPEIWYSVLDEFLTYVLNECPNFKILQIKIKFGELRIYLEHINEKIASECSALETLLSDSHLIY